MVTRGKHKKSRKRRKLTRQNMDKENLQCKEKFEKKNQKLLEYNNTKLEIF